MKGKFLVRRGDGYLGVFLGILSIMVTRLTIEIYAICMGKQYGLQISLANKEE